VEVGKVEVGKVVGKTEEWGTGVGETTGATGRGRTGAVPDSGLTWRVGVTVGVVLKGTTVGATGTVGTAGTTAAWGTAVAEVGVAGIAVAEMGPVAPEEASGIKSIGGKGWPKSTSVKSTATIGCPVVFAKC
jgi:hypothetical protein